MAKRLFLLLISSLIEVVFGANILSATDIVLTKTPGYDAVETVIEPEIEKPIIEEVSSEPAVVYYAPVLPKNYTITSVTSEIVEYPSYYDIYRTGKFIYAHNSSNLFGSLSYLNYGEIFTITEGGVTRSYRVMDKVVYEKAANGLLNGSKAVTKEVEYNANGYDISMMTCYGTMYGNGDASHRLVLFANAI
ncbi:hypothetical protein IJH15_01965 [Candidatus Saccharibacteria bacterium]|nr:hypothetical protein [Candidatus Saccharibacteria bacterium]